MIGLIIGIVVSVAFFILILVAVYLFIGLKLYKYFLGWVSSFLVLSVLSALIYVTLGGGIDTYRKSKLEPKKQEKVEQLSSEVTKVGESQYSRAGAHIYLDTGDSVDILITQRVNMLFRPVDGYLTADDLVLKNTDKMSGNMLIYTVYNPGSPLKFTWREEPN